jgi:hypothetical protein
MRSSEEQKEKERKKEVEIKKGEGLKEVCPN